MAFMGLNPEKARTLSSTMRQTGQASDDLSSQVTAALTLAQLESDLPGQLVFISDELEQLGLIIEARVDIAEGFVIDPTRLAADIGITLAQAEAAIAAFADPEVKPKQITPFIDALAANKQAAEILRSSFVNMPALGTDAELDQALLRLATWLPDALETGTAPALTEDQVRDLGLLANSLEIPGAVSSAGSEIVERLIGGAAAFADAPGGVPINLADLNPEQLTGYGNALFGKVAEAFELDQRLRAAAGLPTVEDMLLQFQIQADRVSPFDTKFEALDAWLPQFTVGALDAADLPQTSADRHLLLEFARQFGYVRDPDVQTLADFEALAVTAQEGVFDRALTYFRRARWVQKSLIPGDFEAVEGPIIVWSEQGVESALLAGRRQGVITEETERIANLVADNVLVDNPDGSDTPIELNQEQQQALVAAIIAQNGEAFVMESPNIQRQIVSAINLVKQQTTLTGQRTVFAKAIEAFRSLNAVGSPAVTWRQLKEIVGADVVDELGHERLSVRSAGTTSRHPQFITLINHWGIPGEDTIKMKKRKFSFRFDENGKLARVRNKKLSKWKRFKNSVKAFGKALWSEWKDNPWKYLFMGHAGLLPGANQFAEGVEQGDFDEAVEGGYTMTKFAASIAATVFPATTAAGIAAMAVLAADTIYQASQGDWLGALGSAFSVAGGAAGYIGDVAAVGSTANMVSNAAAVGEGVVKAIDVGDDFVGAVKDGDIFAALGSGFSIAGSAAKIVGSASELANGVGAAMSGVPVPEVVSALTEGSLALDPSVLTEGLTHSVVSSDTIGLIGEIGETASNLGTITTGIDSTLNAINNDNIAGALTSGLMTLGRTAGTIANPNGVIDNAFSADMVGTVGEFGVTAAQLAQLTAQAAGTIQAIDQGNLQGAITGGINAIGTGINAATDDRGIIDDGLGTSEGLEGQIRSVGVTLGDLGTAVGAGFDVANAIDQGDLIGILSDGYSLVGDVSDLVTNKRGIVAGLVRSNELSPEAAQSLVELAAKEEAAAVAESRDALAPGSGPTTRSVNAIGVDTSAALSPDQQAALVNLGAQEETAARLDAAVLGNPPTTVGPPTVPTGSPMDADGSLPALTTEENESNLTQTNGTPVQVQGEAGGHQLPFVPGKSVVEARVGVSDRSQLQSAGVFHSTALEGDGSGRKLTNENGVFVNGGNEVINAEHLDGSGHSIAEGNDGSTRVEDYDFTSTGGTFDGKVFKIGGQYRHDDIEITETRPELDGSTSYGKGSGDRNSIGAGVHIGLKADETFMGQDIEVEVGLGGSLGNTEGEESLTFTNPDHPDRKEYVKREHSSWGLGIEANLGVETKDEKGAIGDGSSIGGSFGVDLPLVENFGESTVVTENDQVVERNDLETTSGLVNKGFNQTVGYDGDGGVSDFARQDWEGALFPDRKELRVDFEPDGDEYRTELEDNKGIVEDNFSFIEKRRDKDGNEQGLKIDFDDGWFSDTTTEEVTKILDDGSTETTTITITEPLFGEVTVDKTTKVKPAEDMFDDLPGNI